ncbi:MAG: 2-hydroxyacyl-CoA dehydratase [Lachnospiraceae bacterium]|nr:2-hydroxyacyl-CoA dehydratase [Lachnospiraceae bacterium]HCJ08784.1 2-hydroxyglutaryl-CoA dehydratase [Lachnospiraceae bacterium]
MVNANHDDDIIQVHVASGERVEFTKEMRKDYTILIPDMLPVHFKLLRNIFTLHGYRVGLLKNTGRKVVDTGLKYVHNDTCYPALLVIGQMISALQSGKYDVNKVALMITQTGGGCRASNYIHLLRKALVKAGLGHVPVISLNLSGLESNSGFHLTLEMIYQALIGLTYGDLFMLLKNQVRSYEVNKGDADALIDKWVKELSNQFRQRKGYTPKGMERNMKAIVEDFTKIPVTNVKKTKVGVVGEIYVKYSSMANNDLENFLVEQDCEVMVPGVMGFMMFKIDNRIEDINLYGGNPAKKKVCQLLMKYCEMLEKMLYNVVSENSEFLPPSKYAHIKQLITGVVGLGNKMGEGWLLTAEMLELAESGYGNIICAQPFGCLPNHIVGKGMIRKVKEIYPNANIVPIDYDPGATKVNQENRIKLMLAVAREEVED